MRTQLWAMVLTGILGVSLAACGDDDAGHNQNNTTGTCGDNTAEGSETCDGSDLRGSDCVSIDEGYTGGTLACHGNCDDWDISGCLGGATCGDNNAEDLEVCDGTDLGNQDCTTIGLGFVGGVLDCNENCDGWISEGCISPTCGDDVAEGNEVCDGADLDNQDCVTIGQGFAGGTLACSGTCDGWVTTGCTLPTCGDDVAEGFEVCDGTDLRLNGCLTVPGNFSGGTLTCDATCLFDTSACTGSTLLCGNGTLDASEQCDGGNLGSDDCTTVSGGYAGGTLNCSSSCTFDVQHCTGGSSTCGNNLAEGGERCDGNHLNGETCATLGYGFTGGTLACSADCRLWDYSGCTVSAPVCGDGVIEGFEGCDTGQLGFATCAGFGFTGGTLACGSSCYFDFSGCTSGIAGWTCSPDLYGTGDGCHCGCGVVDPDCADSSATACDHCFFFGSCDLADCGSASSTIDPANNAVCTGSSCGNDAAEGLELCDGQDLRGFACTDLNSNYAGGTLACAGSCSFDESGCTQFVCGNNTAEGFEYCDGSDIRNLSCADLGAGYASGSLTCLSGCNFDTSQCVPAVCGDGTQDGHEQCDDGNNAPGDGCDAYCQLEWNYITESESNNDYTSADGPYPNSTVATGTIGVAGDFDYYAITVPQGASIMVEVSDGGSEDCEDMLMDTEVEIYEPNGTTSVAFNDDMAVDNLCSMTGVAGTGNGTYFVRVSASQTSAPTATFSYELIVTVR